MASIANLERISAPQLRELLLQQASSGKQQVAVIDVRDDDHIGGHIANSTNHPSHTLDYAMPTIIRKHGRTPILVFHCALSQVRGPKAALQYIRERERLAATRPSLSNPAAGKSTAGVSATVGETMARSAAEGEAGGAEQEGEWEDVREGEAFVQKVYVLKDGFQGWQAVYGEDESLTTAYRKELWNEEDY